MYKSIFSRSKQSKIAGKKIQNNTWFHYCRESEVVIIFVHGLLSNSHACWTSKLGKYWPEIVRDDSRFESPSIYLGGYHTAPDSGEYKLRDCAEEIIRALEREGGDGIPPPISFDNIIFVCHSLGGNVVRYVLESHKDKFSAKTVGLVLMASPSMGSEYADTLSGLISYYKNGMAKQLTHMSEALEELDSRFKILIEEKLIPNLIGAEAVEHHPLFRSHLLIGLKPVVTKESAARYFAHYQLLPGTDHSTIVKPESANDQGHLFLYDFYSTRYKSRMGLGQKIKGNAIPNECKGNEEDSALVNKVLFDVYTKACSEYYVMRDIDYEVSNALSMYSLWLSGASGFGKTSIARHLLYGNGFKHVEVCLSSCRGKLNQHSLIVEIATTVGQHLGRNITSSSLTLTMLSSLLAEYSQDKNFILYLDEVPLAENDSHGINEFSNIISDLLDATKRATENPGVRFIISSIAAPVPHAGFSTKFSEHIKPVQVNRWAAVELGKMLEMLIGFIRIHNFNSSEYSSIISASNGSPRFLKSYLRNRLAYKDKLPPEILEMTRIQFIS